MNKKKKISNHKAGFDWGTECRRLNENLIIFHLYKNLRSSNLLRRRDDQWNSIWEVSNSKKHYFHMDENKKLLQSLEQTTSNTKKLRGCDYE